MYKTVRHRERLGKGRRPRRRRAAGRRRANEFFSVGEDGKEQGFALAYALLSDAGE
jgi:hypothetical protein